MMMTLMIMMPVNKLVSTTVFLMLWNIASVTTMHRMMIKMIMMRLYKMTMIIRLLEMMMLLMMMTMMMIIMVMI